MEKIRSVSRVIRLMLMMAALFEVSSWGYFVFVADADIARVGPITLTWDELDATSTQLTAAGLHSHVWLSTPATAFHLALYGLLFGLFGQYRRGNVFSFRAVLAIRRIGLTLVLWPLVEVVYPPLLMLALKFSGVVDHGELSIVFGSSKVEMMVAGAMIMVIGWVMAEGCRLKDEQELTI